MSGLAGIGGGQPDWSIDDAAAPAEAPGAEVAAAPAGAARVDLPDPAALTRDLGSLEQDLIRWAPLDGQLFVDGISLDDATQGRIGDCYLVAAMGAIAHAAPERIQDLIRENADGSFTVSFHTKAEDGTPGRTEVRVDRDLVTHQEATGSEAEGSPVYASSTDRAADGGLELWPAIVEKAYAQLKGGFDAIGFGGVSSEALEALTGSPTAVDVCGARANEVDRAFAKKLNEVFKFPEETVLKGRIEKREQHAEESWAFLKESLAAGGALVAQSYSEADVLRQGVLPMHAYSVVGVEEKDGERFVTLRNAARDMAALDNDPAIAEEMKALPEFKAMLEAIQAEGGSAKAIRGTFTIPFADFRQTMDTVHRATLR